MKSLSLGQFRTLAAHSRLVPVFREVAADLETPVSVYWKLRDQGPSFLLESVEKGEQVGRYSILGAGPRRQLISRNKHVSILDNGRSESRSLAPGQDPLHAVQSEMERYQPVAPIHEVTQALPPFFGGVVGYLGYGLARFFEHLPGAPDDGLDLPDLHLLVTDTLVVFDHVQHQLLLFANAHVPPGTDLDAAYQEAAARLDAVQARLALPLPPLPGPPAGLGDGGSRDLRSNMPRAEFEAGVRRAQDYIAGGQVYQLSPSHQMERLTEANPFSIYRALRRLIPSSHMFFLDLGGSPQICLIGSSPKMQVRYESGRVELRPVAGSRARGASLDEDEQLEAEMRSDPKALAEHAMLVDLVRNDLGRVSRFGTVTVSDLMAIERDSQVINLVSRVTGVLCEDADVYDLLRATFPAGSVSGVPKVKAMKILQELEGWHRGPFGGAVGYLGFNGSVETCIAMRMIVMNGPRAYLPTGTVVTAASDPAAAWEASIEHAAALAAAIELAEKGL